MSWMGKQFQGTCSCKAHLWWREWVTQRKGNSNFEGSVCVSGMLKSHLYLADGLEYSPRADFEIWHYTVIIMYQERSDVFLLIPPLLLYWTPAKIPIFSVPGPYNVFCSSPVVSKESPVDSGEASSCFYCWITRMSSFLSPCPAPWTDYAVQGWPRWFCVLSCCLLYWRRFPVCFVINSKDCAEGELQAVVPIYLLLNNILWLLDCCLSPGE